MSQPNPSTGTRGSNYQTYVFFDTPSAKVVQFFYHKPAIRIVDFQASPVTAPTAAYTTTLGSYAVTTQTDIMGKAQTNPAAGTQISLNTVTGSLTRPANEILSITYSTVSGSPVLTMFTLTYVILDV